MYGGKPVHQRQVAAMHDRAGRESDLFLALAAHPALVALVPVHLLAAALRTHHTMLLALLLQITLAILFRRELTAEFQ